MRSRLLFGLVGVAAFAGIAVAIVVSILPQRTPSLRRPSEDEAAGLFPTDWFGAQRAWPYDHIPQESFRQAARQAMVERTAQALSTSGTVQPVWTQAGPFNIGGLVTALDAVPGGASVYLASANGGVFKSVNSGVNWTPISDGMPFFSIGALAIDPNDNDLVYVGTGEANAATDSYDGDGLWRWNEAAQSWTHLGLDATARIGRIAIDSQNSNRIYVAAMGHLFSTDSNRGLYRSEDGGQTWSQVLYVNDSTGVTDVAVNPAHPETVFVATWECLRRPTYRRAYGPDCGIWRSIDYGSTWTRLQAGLPAPSDTVGRIGLAIAPSTPSTIYAQIMTGANLGYQGLGMYRSEDGGDTWVRRDVSGFTDIFGGFSWFFGRVAVSPSDPDEVWSLGPLLARSTDGGQTYTYTTETLHADQHAVWFDPLNPSHVYIGNDGGFYSSVDDGASWTKSVDLPITQFYAADIDPSNPQRLIGGTQDNYTLITDGSPSGWYKIFPGDGFYCLIDPTDPNVIFAEYYYCCYHSGPFRSVDGGANFTPPSGFVDTDRYNWCAPYVMDPSDHEVVLVGSQRVYKSTDNGVSYSIVSGDLTTNPPAQWDFGTITTLAISPVSPRIYLAGTDDGRVWRSRDAGSTWENISAGLPVRYVTRVTADPADSNVVYVTHSGFGL